MDPRDPLSGLTPYQVLPLTRFGSLPGWTPFQVWLLECQLTEGMALLKQTMPICLVCMDLHPSFESQLLHDCGRTATAGQTVGRIK